MKSVGIEKKSVLSVLEKINLTTKEIGDLKVLYDLLSSEKLLSIAEEESHTRLKNICDRLFGMVDLFSFLLIILPLYPKTVEDYVYSVSLFGYREAAVWIRTVYWLLFLSMNVMGILKMVAIQFKREKDSKLLTCSSVVINIAAVLFLAVAGETYAVVISFLLLTTKMMLVFSSVKA